MKVGSLVFSTVQGLGILAKQLYDNRVITDCLVVRHGRRDEHPEWFGRADAVNPRIHGVEMRDFCKSMDLMLFLETPFDWSLIQYCRDVGVRTVIMPMYECFHNRGWDTLPDLFLCPSLLDLEMFCCDYRRGDPIVPGQILVDKRGIRSSFVPFPAPWITSGWVREWAHTFVHNAGHGGLRGRNGTRELLEAIRYVKSPARFILRSQEPGVFDDYKARVGYACCSFQEGTQGWETLFSDGDVFVFPEKFNGLSLPLQEAYASGMLVMATDRFPVNTWLPNGPLIEPRGYIKDRVGSSYPPFDSAVLEPTDIAGHIDSWYGQPIDSYSRQGLEWARVNSWDNLLPVYRKLLRNICGLPT